jgi:hypothetical protein
VLQARLREQNAVLEFAVSGTTSAGLPGIVVDDEAAEFTGRWVATNYGTPIDSGSRHDGDTDKGAKTARFAVTLPRPGRYEVRFAYTPAPNRASAVPIMVEHADGIATVSVNQKVSPPLEKHFVSLGTFRFAADKPASVTISNAGTEGYVSVDAVQFIESSLRSSR